MNLLCISASNMINKPSIESTSYKFCNLVISEFEKRTENVSPSIVELKDVSLKPCIGCGKCYDTHRCFIADDFNSIYEKVIKSDAVFIVSPHYAPIPAKLSALLEKMEQITFLHWGKDNTYISEVNGIPTGVISHGGGEKWALKSYKAMVNDTIANALDTIQLKLIPLNDEWNTGISLPVSKTINNQDKFPLQEYDWNFIRNSISAYVDQVIKSIAMQNSIY